MAKRRFDLFINLAQSREMPLTYFWKNRDETFRFVTLKRDILENHNNAVSFQMNVIRDSNGDNKKILVIDCR